MRGRRTGRWRVGAAVALAVVVAGGAALLIWRMPLAEWAAGRYLAAHGFPEASGAVSRLGWGGATVDALSLGPDLPTIERIDITYAPNELLDRRLRAVRLQGLRATVDLSNPAALDRLARLLPAGDGTGTAGGPAVEVADARIVLRTPEAGEIGVVFEAAADLTQDPAPASLEGRAEAAFGQAFLTLRTGDLAGPAAEIEATATVRLDRLPGPTGLQGGTLDVSLSGTLPMPSPSEPFLGLLARTGTLAANLTVHEAAWPPYAAALDLRAALVARTGDGGLDLRLAEPAVLTARGLPAAAPRTIENAGLALEVRQPAKGKTKGELGVAARLADDHLEATVQGAMNWAPAGGTGILPLKLTADLEARGIALPAGRVQSAAWRGDGVVAAASANMAGAFEARLDLPAAGEVEVTGDIGLSATPAGAGELQLLEGRIRLPGPDLVIAPIEATVPLPRPTARQPARVSATVAAPGRLGPLGLEAAVAAEDGAFVVDGSVGLAGGSATIPLGARVRMAGREGSVTLGPETLTFGPDALPAAVLASLLPGVARVEGAVEVSARAGVAPGTPTTGEAALAFRRLSMETAAATVEGLEGAIRLDGLFPPRTGGPQTLAADRLVIGVPLEAPSIRFRVEPADGAPALIVERAEAGFAGGTIAVDDARWRPAAGSNAATIEITGLSLEMLLRDYAMEGLSGTGTLSGTIPLAVSPEGLTIDEGRLAAEGGGVLKVAWGSAREALVGQGESVALMVRALEDFRYSTLRAIVGRPAAGSLAITLTLEGHNPAVLDGYPFRFNVTLGGDLEEIVAAVREGGKLGTDLLRGDFGGGP